MRRCGTMVLKAELKSTNSNLTYESLLSRWVRAEWRAEKMASSEDRLARINTERTPTRNVHQVAGKTRSGICQHGMDSLQHGADPGWQGQHKVDFTPTQSGLHFMWHRKRPLPKHSPTATIKMDLLKIQALTRKSSFIHDLTLDKGLSTMCLIETWQPPDVYQSLNEACPSGYKYIRNCITYSCRGRERAEASWSFVYRRSSDTKYSCGSRDTFKFLGTTISRDLKWTGHIDSVRKKAQQRLYFLRQLKKFNLPRELLKTFYTAIIQSVLSTSITA
ncbi:carbohydrate deacetylase isoform X4 [Syngnathus typhle]|uniref:carbohydrate deacetylase isoform X4 n=1 Tax=Syngnathus typhle TaxID=161592 RepID=UPI002A69D5E2|nr:carbohydrate deacetylase isoform X4 [Syngnathus typhle]